MVDVIRRECTCENLTCLGITKINKEKNVIKSKCKRCGRIHESHGKIYNMSNYQPRTNTSKNHKNQKRL